MESGTLPPLIGRDAVCALTGWTCSMLLMSARIGTFVKPQIIRKNGSPSLRWQTKQVAQWLAANGYVRPARRVSWRRSRSAAQLAFSGDAAQSSDARVP